MTDLRNYAVVTAAYWTFTLSDGALRMLVLLHFYTLGFTPFQLAFLFLLYEFFGVVTNLLGGWVRFAGRHQGHSLRRARPAGPGAAHALGVSMTAGH